MFWFIFIASIYLTILVLVSIFRQKSAPAERRVALVIGNAAYESIAPLKNPKNDATDVAKALKRLGFKVDERHNLHVTEMRDALADFGNNVGKCKDKARNAAWALVYYAGHGMEWSGKNWLIPICVKPADSVDLKDRAILAEDVLNIMSGASKLRIVILDACRTDSLPTPMMMNEDFLRVAHGLAAMKPAHGEVVFFAARHGTKSHEGRDEHRNGFFTAALLKHIEKDGLELGQFIRRVTNDVLKATKDPKGQERWKPQEPFVYGHIPDEDFYFKPPRRPR